MTRRSIRKYSSRPVDDVMLNELLEQAERTQTMGNLQLYSVVVTRSDEMKQKLAPCHFNQPMVTQASVLYIERRYFLFVTYLIISRYRKTQT